MNLWELRQQKLENPKLTVQQIISQDTSKPKAPRTEPLTAAELWDKMDAEDRIGLIAQRIKEKKEREAQAEKRLPTVLRNNLSYAQIRERQQHLRDTGVIDPMRYAAPATAHAKATKGFSYRNEAFKNINENKVVKDILKQDQGRVFHNRLNYICCKCGAYLSNAVKREQKKSQLKKNPLCRYCFEIAKD